MWTYFSSEKLPDQYKRLKDGIYLSKFINGNDNDIAFAFLSVENKTVYFITALENKYLKCLKIDDFPDYMISQSDYNNNSLYKDACKIFCKIDAQSKGDNLVVQIHLQFCIFDGNGSFVTYTIGFADIIGTYVFDIGNSEVLSGKFTNDDTIKLIYTSTISKELKNVLFIILAFFANNIKK